MMKQLAIILTLSALSTFVVADHITCVKAVYIDDYMGAWHHVNSAALKYPGGAGPYLKLGEQSEHSGYSYTGANKICARVKNEAFTYPSDYYESYMIAGKAWCQAEMSKRWTETYGPQNCDCHISGLLFQYVALEPTARCPVW